MTTYSGTTYLGYFSKGGICRHLGDILKRIGEEEPDVNTQILIFLSDNGITMVDLLEIMIMCDKISALPDDVKASLQVQKEEYLKEK